MHHFCSSKARVRRGENRWYSGNKTCSSGLACCLNISLREFILPWVILHSYTNIKLTIAHFQPLWPKIPPPLHARDGCLKNQGKNINFILPFGFNISFNPTSSSFPILLYKLSSIGMAVISHKKRIITFLSSYNILKW